MRGPAAASHSSRPRNIPQDGVHNNLKQISVALMQYENHYGCFPPAYVADRNGRPMHSCALILPYLGEKDLYDQYKFDEPWSSPHNIALAARMPKVFSCPSERSPNTSETSYLMFVGPGMFSNGPESTTPEQLTRGKGASMTMMLIESAQSGVNWMEPRDPLDNVHTNRLRGLNVAFADGRVEFLMTETLKLKLAGRK